MSSKVLIDFAIFVRIKLRQASSTARPTEPAAKVNGHCTKTGNKQEQSQDIELMVLHKAQVENLGPQISTAEFDHVLHPVNGSVHGVIILQDLGAPKDIR